MDKEEIIDCSDIQDFIPRPNFFIDPKDIETLFGKDPAKVKAAWECNRLYVKARESQSYKKSQEEILNICSDEEAQTHVKNNIARHQENIDNIMNEINKNLKILEWIK